MIIENFQRKYCNAQRSRNSAKNRYASSSRNLRSSGFHKVSTLVEHERLTASLERELRMLSEEIEPTGREVRTSLTLRFGLEHKRV